jgi:hypothetical protein
VLAVKLTTRQSSGDMDVTGRDQGVDDLVLVGLQADEIGMSEARGSVQAVSR